mmetsp:Transcript_116378/g.340465  ORF Transcript_116378/g.340465 Transcript_116378/m.340465 type:complete len:248 (+) Transcript_116378:423-1166(+)
MSGSFRGSCGTSGMEARLVTPRPTSMRAHPPLKTRARPVLNSSNSLKKVPQRATCIIAPLPKKRGVLHSTSPYRVDAIWKARTVRCSNTMTTPEATSSASAGASLPPWASMRSRRSMSVHLVTSMSTAPTKEKTYAKLQASRLALCAARTASSEARQKLTAEVPRKGSRVPKATSSPREYRWSVCAEVSITKQPPEASSSSPRACAQVNFSCKTSGASIAFDNKELLNVTQTMMVAGASTIATCPRA